MASSIEMLKIDLVDQLDYMARHELAPEPAEQASVFLRALYSDVPPSDLVPERPEVLLERGLSLLEFISERAPNTAKVRVYEPERAQSSGEPAHTACVAFGMDRLAIAMFQTHGSNVARWPIAVRDLL